MLSKGEIYAIYESFSTAVRSDCHFQLIFLVSGLTRPSHNSADILHQIESQIIVRIEVFQCYSVQNDPKEVIRRDLQRSRG